MSTYVHENCQAGHFAVKMVEVLRRAGLVPTGSYGEVLQETSQADFFDRLKSLPAQLAAVTGITTLNSLQSILRLQLDDPYMTPDALIDIHDSEHAFGNLSEVVYQQLTIGLELIVKAESKARELGQRIESAKVSGDFVDLAALDLLRELVLPDLVAQVVEKMVDGSARFSGAERDGVLILITGAIEGLGLGTDGTTAVYERFVATERRWVDRRTDRTLELIVRQIRSQDLSRETTSAPNLRPKI